MGALVPFLFDLAIFDFKNDLLNPLTNAVNNGVETLLTRFGTTTIWRTGNTNPRSMTTCADWRGRCEGNVNADGVLVDTTASLTCASKYTNRDLCIMDPGRNCRWIMREKYTGTCSDATVTTYDACKAAGHKWADLDNPYLEPVQIRTGGSLDKCPKKIVDGVETDETLFTHTCTRDVKTNNTRNTDLRKDTGELSCDIYNDEVMQNAVDIVREAAIDNKTEDRTAKKKHRCKYNWEEAQNGDNDEKVRAWDYCKSLQPDWTPPETFDIDAMRIATGIADPNKLKEGVRRLAGGSGFLSLPSIMMTMPILAVTLILLFFILFYWLFSRMSKPSSAATRPSARKERPRSRRYSKWRYSTYQRVLPTVETLEADPEEWQHSSLGSEPYGLSRTSTAVASEEKLRSRKFKYAKWRYSTYQRILPNAETLEADPEERQHSTTTAIAAKANASHF